MPERIVTAEIVSIDSQTLEISSAYPDTYGFYVRLSRDPGVEWAAELESAYIAAPHPIHPPLAFRGDTLCVFFLPLYQDRLPEFLVHLEGIVASVNAAIERRNRALPDDSAAREAFRTRLFTAAEEFQARR